MTEPGSAMDRVKGPAIGLLIVGILGVVFGVLGLLNSLLGLGLGAAQLQQMQEQGQQVPEWAKYFMGGGAGAVQIISNLVGIGCSVLVAVGGMKMQKLQSKGLCTAASVIAMIPCLSPCCCVGLPIGIWALIVLNKPEVRTAFGPPM